MPDTESDRHADTVRRPTPFGLPWSVDWWLIDHARWYRRRYYTPTPSDHSDGEVSIG